jgi:predicted RecB family endonuclease
METIWLSIEDLEHALEDAQNQLPMTAVESAITVYQAAQAVIDAYTAVKDAAKQLVADVMTETGQTAYNTQAGKASITAPSMTVSYDAKAIDILLRDDADLALRLSPYRKVTERAGSLRITAGK